VELAMAREANRLIMIRVGGLSQEGLREMPAITAE
jgi:hypothetical protein